MIGITGAYLCRLDESLAAIDEARVVDVLLEIWMAAIYGGQPPRSV